MMELFEGVWKNWQQWVSIGKFPALLLVSIAFLWLSSKNEAQKRLVRLATLTTALCVLPVTAVGMLWYQTKFYDYPWIWSCVPMTAVIACAAVFLWSRYLVEWKRSWGSAVVFFLVLCGVLFLSGAPGYVPAGLEKAEQTIDAQAWLDKIRNQSQKEEICLWAPKDLMGELRMEDGSVKLYYGRNMWDPRLNAYSYDTYPKTLAEDFEWMESGIISWEAKMKDTKDRVRRALESGVNVIMLRGELDRIAVDSLADDMGMQYTVTDGYYLLTK
jgi:hypothetical protein